MKHPPQRDVGDDWHDAFERLMADSYLSKKYNRQKGLDETIWYIRQWCPRVLAGCRVIDVGPGFGHFLEWCQHFGCEASGIDAESGDGGMGDGYLALSQLLCERQQIPVAYIGYDSWIEWMRVSPSINADLINFRGSFAQCYSWAQTGIQHHVNHDASEQAWRFDDSLRLVWLRDLTTLKRHLADGGFLLMSVNKIGDVGNQMQFSEEIQAVAEDSGLILERHVDYTYCWKTD